jgi:hypothetical protein
MRGRYWGEDAENWKTSGVIHAKIGLISVYNYLLETIFPTGVTIVQLLDSPVGHTTCV